MESKAEAYEHDHDAMIEAGFVTLKHSVINKELKDWPVCSFHASCSADKLRVCSASESCQGH